MGIERLVLCDPTRMSGSLLSFFVLLSLIQVSSTLSSALNTIVTPYGQLTPLSSSQFSIVSWNILLPNSVDNWWCEKMFANHVPMECRQWPHRQTLIADRVKEVDPDILCIQEADGETFDKDFEFMKEAGYASVLHKKVTLLRFHP